MRLKNSIMIILFFVVLLLPLSAQRKSDIASAEDGPVSVERISEDILSQGRIAIYDIHFPPEKADILPESSDALANIAEFLNAHRDRKFFVVGHTAATGLFFADMSLSMDRAQRVVEELVESYGVEEDQLLSWGVAALCPVVSNKTDEGMARNRRIELVEAVSGW